MSEQQQEPVVETHSANLGEQLRQAREQKKYSIAEVAAQLRLTKDIVSHLENQQWDRLNGRIYARGYFASYVKFLGLPHDEMLAVFNLEYSATEPTLNLNQHRHGAIESPFPWVMLFFVVIVLVVGWFAYQQWQTAQMAAQTSSDDQTEEFAAEGSSFMEPVPATPTETMVDEPDVMAEPLSTYSEYDSADELALEQNDLSEPDTGEAMLEQDVLVEPEVETETEQAVIEPEPVPEPEAPASTLKLSFSGECWVEVTNSESKVLVSKVMRAQDSLELSSELPLKLLLGRAEFATVIFNNQQVDLSPFTQGNVARLTLGVES
jgi:cytoskeleton protein RodZ